MSEFESSHARTSTSPAIASSKALVKRTAAEQATDAVFGFERAVLALEQHASELAAAAAGSDPERFQGTLSAFGDGQGLVRQAREIAEALRGEASAEDRARLDALVQRADGVIARPVPEAPTGIQRMTVEDQLLQVLPAGPVRDAKHVMQQIEAQVGAIISGLSTVDTLAFQQRLKRNHKSDEVVRRFRRLGGERQAKLQALLESSKRKARVAAAEAAAKAATPAMHDATRAPLDEVAPATGDEDNPAMAASSGSDPRHVEDAHHPAAGASSQETHTEVAPAVAQPEAVARTAEAGVAGPGESLPHLQTIQRSFGAYDVSQVRAHVGGGAAAAAGAIGAEAYATGDQVAFRATPDLHTAAHEAAHVVQNQAGAEAVTRAAGGALTSPDDAHEKHADAVADQVVRGESAASLLAAAPAGNGSVARKPATVKAPADAAAAMNELKAQLEHGVTDPARIPILVAMLPWPDQVWVRDNKLAEIEAACTASQVIAILGALGQEPLAVVKAALRKHASRAELAGVIGQLSTSELVELASDADAFGSVRAKLPGPVSVYTQWLNIGTPSVAQNAALIRWFIETSTPGQVWRTIVTVPDPASLTATLEQENLWSWLSGLSPAGLTSSDEHALRGFAKVAPTHVKPKVEAIADALPQPPGGLAGEPSEAEYSAAQKVEAAAETAAGVQLGATLTGARPTSATEILELAAKARSGAKALGKDPAARRRVLAMLDLEQVATFVHVLQMEVADKLDWLLDVHGVGANYLIEAFRSEFSSEMITAAFSSPLRVRRLHKVIGSDISLLDTVWVPAALQKVALANAELRVWLLGAATPLQLFKFVTMGTTAESISAACNAVATEHGYGWVYELSGQGDSVNLRRLALACPDRAASTHLAKFGIHGFAPAKGDTLAGSEAAPQAIYNTPGDQLRGDVASGNGSQIAANAAEMSEDDRAALRRDRTLVDEAIRASAAGSNAGFDAVRTARELNGSLPETIRAIGEDAWSVDHGAFRAYARERPASEQIAAASAPDLAQSAEKLLQYSPFNSLPGVREPGALATALHANPALLRWIERLTSSVEAISLLGATPAVAAASARALEIIGAGIIKSLPHTGLTVVQRAALTRIGGEATAQPLHEAIADQLDDNVANDRAKRPPDELDGGKPLGDVLDALKRGNASAQEIQAACNAHPHAEALDLLTGSHPKRIEFLRQLGVSPLTVFPWLGERPLASYASFAVIDWMLATEEPIAMLRAIAAAPKVIGLVAVQIDGHLAGASHWLTNLPSGHGLAPGDETTLHAVYTQVTSDVGAAALFTTRFGQALEGNWPREALDKMWVTLARLPDGQVEANRRLSGITKGSPDDPSGLGGYYTAGTGIVTVSNDGGTEERYQKGTWQSKQQLAAQLGVDDAEIDRRISAELIVTQQEKGVTMYRVKPVSSDNLTDTLLHEVGHSVDAMLGSRTDLVYDMAGWRSYAGGDFDAWAADMNAWAGARVTDEDKDDIRMVFEQRLQSSSAISGPQDAFVDLVPGDHALRSPRNKNAFVAKAVKSTARPFVYTDPIEHNGRVFVMNHHYGRFMSYDAKIRGILPLPYAGFAPQEFFAECYVEYYRDEQSRGGNLPSWTKKWFDQNVHRVGHGPIKKP